MTDSPAAKPNDEVDTNTASAVNQWDRFWFADGSVQAAARLRALLCVITAAYFISALLDVSTWLVATAPFSTDRTGTFLQAAGLQSDARWMISPLFLLDSLLGSHAVVYYAYLLIGVALCVLVSLGRGGKAMPWLLWLVFVGWANRLVILAGISETLLSLGLFAAAIAPPASWRGDERSDWKAGFSLRLSAAQITLFAACTTATMLAGNVWWNGLGAYALVAPVEDRTLAVRGRRLGVCHLCDSRYADAFAGAGPADRNHIGLDPASVLGRTDHRRLLVHGSGDAGFTLAVRNHVRSHDAGDSPGWREDTPFFRSLTLQVESFG